MLGDVISLSVFIEEFTPFANRGAICFHSKLVYIETLKDANQHYAIFQDCNLLAVSECLHLAIFKETLRIERAILSELTCILLEKWIFLTYYVSQLKANWKDQCVQIYYIVRASLTRIVFSSRNLGCLQVKC